LGALELCAAGEGPIETGYPPNITDAQHNSIDGSIGSYRHDDSPNLDHVDDPAGDDDNPRNGSAGIDHDDGDLVRHNDTNRHHGADDNFDNRGDYNIDGRNNDHDGSRDHHHVGDNYDPGTHDDRAPGGYCSATDYSFGVGGSAVWFVWGGVGWSGAGGL
jgi:hypothetical protein